MKSYLFMFCTKASIVYTRYTFSFFVFSHFVSLLLILYLNLIFSSAFFLRSHTWCYCTYFILVILKWKVSVDLRYRMGKHFFKVWIFNGVNTNICKLFFLFLATDICILFITYPSSTSPLSNELGNWNDWLSFWGTLRYMAVCTLSYHDQVSIVRFS